MADRDLIITRAADIETRARHYGTWDQWNGADILCREPDDHRVFIGYYTDDVNKVSCPKCRAIITSGAMGDMAALAAAVQQLTDALLEVVKPVVDALAKLADRLPEKDSGEGGR